MPHDECNKCQDLDELQTKLFESEKKFKLLFERAPLSYQSLDINGNIIEVNNMWLKTLGYTKEEVIGKNMSCFLTDEWAHHFNETFPKFKNVGEILGSEFELKKKDGSKILVSVQGRIGYDEKGAFKQTHCIWNDITVFRESQEKYNRLEKELLKSKKSEAIGRFAREIIHDINNILTPIVFSIDMLKQEISKADHSYQWIEIMTKGIDRAKELLDQIHSFSRPTEKDSHTCIYIQPVIEEVLELIKAPPNISLIKKIDSFDFCVYGSQLKIHQIMMNLATNAIYAIEPNEGTFTVKLELVDEKNNDLYIPTSPEGLFCCLTVLDDGCGMKQDVLDKIFEPFFTTRSEKTGTGLGLAVIDAIIKSMNGFICVDSEEGKGTKFRVYLPLSKINIYL